MRRWAKDFTSTIVEIGETVTYRLVGKHKYKLDTIWKYGLWLGRDTENGEHLVSNSEGSVLRARSIRRLTPSQKYDKSLLDKLVGLPWNMISSSDEENAHLSPQTVDRPSNFSIPLPQRDHAERLPQQSTDDFLQKQLDEDDLHAARTTTTFTTCNNFCTCKLIR